MSKSTLNTTLSAAVGRSRSWSHVAGAAALALLAACASPGSDDDDEQGDDGSEDAAADDGDGGGEGPPQFVIAGLVISPEGETGFGVALDSLAAGESIGLSNAATFPGRPTVAVSPARDGSLFVGLSEEPVIQRYQVGRDGSIEFVDEFSMAGLGLSSAQGTNLNGLQIVAEDKGYLFDRETLSIVVFDPREMILRESIPLAGLNRDGLRTGLGFVARDGNRLLISANYFRTDGEVERLAGLAILDMSTDELSYAWREQCGHPVWTAQDSAGNNYWASHPVRAGRHALNPDASPPCMVRVLAGADGYDPDYYINLVELTGGPAGGIMGGAGDQAFTLVFDEDQIPITEETASSMTLLTNWDLYGFELGREAETVALVDTGFKVSRATGFLVEEFDGEPPTPIIATTDSFTGTGSFYDAADPGSFVERVAVTEGIPGVILRLR